MFLVRKLPLTTAYLLVCLLQLGLIRMTWAEDSFRLGVIEDSVETDIFDLIEAPDDINVTLYNLSTFDEYTYENIRKAYAELQSKAVSAVIGDYNSVYAAVSEELKINYYVTSITPEEQPNTKYLFQIFADAKVFAKAVLDLVEYYSFRKIVIFYDSYEGEVVFERVLRRPEVEVRSFKVEESVSEECENDMRRELKAMRDAYFYTFIIVCSKENTDRVLKQGLSLSLLSAPNKWLLVNMGLTEFDLAEYVDSWANLTVLRMMMDVESPSCMLNFDNVSLRRAVVHDGIQYCYAYWELLKGKDVSARLSKGLRKQVNEQRVHGCTGYLEFNYRGRRPRKYLQLMTLQAFMTNQDADDELYIETGENATVAERKITFDPKGTGTWISHGETLNKRVEPSRSYSRVARDEESVFGDEPLRVTTKIEPPFVQYNEEGKLEGHLIDILEEITKLLKFRYNISLVPDGKFGSRKPPPRGWTGMVRELKDDRADVALAPFQMSPSRSEVVDFTKPFMTKGTTVVIRKPEDTGLRIFQFLSPLSDTVWIAIFFSFLVVSFVLFSVSRVNSDRQQKYTNNLRESFWYIWGTLLRGSLTGSPHAISSRIVASSWWFFCLIMISLYTANLAAFLTITNTNVIISSAADLAYQDYYEYGTVDGSQIEYFFKHTSMDHYAKMWAHMSTLRPQSMVRRVEDGFRRVNEGKYAFIWDSPTIRHEISGNCSLMMIGHPFDLKGYGIAYQKGKAYGEAISLAILKLKDEGTMYKLEGKWWRRQFCPDSRSSAKTKSLDVENVVGMYLVLGGGVVISGILCLLQFCMSRPKIKKTKSATYHSDTDKEDCSANVMYERNMAVPVYANHSRVG